VIKSDGTVGFRAGGVKREAKHLRDWRENHLTRAALSVDKNEAKPKKLGPINEPQPDLKHINN
jgi:hypothetical protein